MCVIVASLSRIVLIVALTLGLGASGMGHGPGHHAPGDQGLTQQADPGILAYVQAGGSLDDLCADPEGNAPARQGDCPLCHVPGQGAPQGPDGALRPAALVVIATVRAPRESRAARMVLDPAHGLRAPPLA
jgi:hypothetical protein